MIWIWILNAGANCVFAGVNLLNNDFDGMRFNMMFSGIALIMAYQSALMEKIKELKS